VIQIYDKGAEPAICSCFKMMGELLHTWLQVSRLHPTQAVYTTYVLQYEVGSRTATFPFDPQKIYANEPALLSQKCAILDVEASVINHDSQPPAGP
jgi:hypothetical protein